MNAIKINVINTKNAIEVDSNLTIEDLVAKINTGCRYDVIGAKVNNDIKELRYIVNDGDNIEFLDVSSADGKRIYKRTVLMVMMRAAREVFPDSKVYVKQSLSNSLYCDIQGIGYVTVEHIKQIENRMREIVANGEEIVKDTIPTVDAINLYKELGFEDKERLLRYRTMPETNLYMCGWYKDYFYGFMAPNTSYVKLFRLSLYSPGFILELPGSNNHAVLPAYQEEQKLAHIYFDANKWGDTIDVRDIASLNKAIENNRFKELVLMSEASHELSISQIAKEIYESKDRISAVLIAGPSSSGKTTFSKRLGVQLKVKGLHPVAISMDDYFINRANCPVDKDGKPDFESVDMIDIPLFNDHISRLIQGEQVEIPEFDFIVGSRKSVAGKSLQLKEEDVLVIEGIHALNDRLTCTVPKWQKYKIYITALTHMNIDDHSIIPATDVRLIRRIVRDNLYRGSDATFTMSIWNKVKEGEVKNIFPFQDDADALFNSATVYELSIMKNHIEKLLEEIDRDNIHYSDAKRLRRFLSYISSVDEEEAYIPYNSIIREFIGGSCF